MVFFTVKWWSLQQPHSSYRYLRYVSGDGEVNVELTAETEALKLCDHPLHMQLLLLSNFLGMGGERHRLM